MSRRARLTVLELGASPLSWASSSAPGADDWVVVAQQSDEAAADFTERVQRRARRLRREDAELEAVDVYAAPSNDVPSSSARRNVIQDLSGQMARGGHLTLWTPVENNLDWTTILAQFGPMLAEREITISQKVCGAEPRSGVRHVAPTPPVADYDTQLDFLA